MTRSTDTRRRPPAPVFLMYCARMSVQAELLAKKRMPYVTHLDLVQALDCARKEGWR